MCSNGTDFTDTGAVFWISYDRRLFSSFVFDLMRGRQRVKHHRIFSVSLARVYDHVIAGVFCIKRKVLTSTRTAICPGWVYLTLSTLT